MSRRAHIEEDCQSSGRVRSSEIQKVGLLKPLNQHREMVGFIEERRWVLLKVPRCDIDGVGEGK